MTTASDEMAFNIFAVLTQFEHGLIQKRKQVGLKTARVREKRLQAKDIA
ncbi:hypothetical protein [Prosthecochloris sp.]|nr:hypothetical protein [Prosthecochloris sp.]